MVWCRRWGRRVRWLADLKVLRIGSAILGKRYSYREAPRRQASPRARIHLALSYLSLQGLMPRETDQYKSNFNPTASKVSLSSE